MYFNQGGWAFHPPKNIAFLFEASVGGCNENAIEEEQLQGIWKTFNLVCSTFRSHISFLMGLYHVQALIRPCVKLTSQSKLPASNFLFFLKEGEKKKKRENISGM